MSTSQTAFKPPGHICTYSVRGHRNTDPNAFQRGTYPFRPRLSGANIPASEYQQFFIPYCEDCDYGRHDIDDCCAALAPLVHPWSAQPQPCLNCGDKSHSVIGCQIPLRAGVLIYEGTLPCGCHKGWVELAFDVERDLYEIDPKDWEEWEESEERRMKAKWCWFPKVLFAALFPFC